jgi:heme/copper-type cytochrome/quinol oxidase subunit 2
MFNNKKGQGVAYAWIFGLITLFTLGVIFVVFDQVFVAYLNPIIINQVNNSAIAIDANTKQEIFNGISNYMTMWHILPIVLFLVVVFYMIVVAIRRERADEQY